MTLNSQLLTLRAPITISRLHTPYAEMFLKLKWETVWIRIGLLLWAFWSGAHTGSIRTQTNKQIHVYMYIYTYFLLAYVLCLYWGVMGWWLHSNKIMFFSDSTYIQGRPVLITQSWGTAFTVRKSSILYSKWSRFHLCGVSNRRGSWSEFALVQSDSDHRCLLVIDDRINRNWDS